MSGAYYNEFDPYAAEWLRNLIAAGHIAAGEVDERSITEVQPDDLRGFTQCHFFAGIGGWSLALRLAGWDDSRPVWTGSCPCQPFSAAGKQLGAADERHLWPTWAKLIGECRPAVVFGEQVEAAIRLGWLDLVQADLEGLGYAFGAAGLPAACVGAPHIRQRLWFVAHASGARSAEQCGRRLEPARPAEDDCASSLVAHRERVGRERRQDTRGPFGEDEAERCEGVPDVERGGNAGLVAHSSGTRLEGRQRDAERRDECTAGPCGVAGALADDDAPGRGEQRLAGLRRPAVNDADGCGSGFLANGQEHGRQQGLRHVEERPGLAEHGPWSSLEWLPCRDGKARPTQPGIQPLAHGVPARVGKLRAAGNAIVPQVAAEFIRAAA